MIINRTSSSNLENLRQNYIKDKWSKYPLEKRNEMSKLLAKDGETFKAINKFECSQITKFWNGIKNKMGL